MASSYKKRPFLEMLCACGCGGSTTMGRKYLRGHYAKTAKAKKETSKIHKGKVPWNKGIEMPLGTGEKISKAKKGKVKAWNRGLTKDDSRVAKYAKKLKGREFSETHRRNISKTRIELGLSKGDRNVSKRSEVRKMRSDFMKGRIRSELVGDDNPMNKPGVREIHLQAVNDSDYKKEQGRQSRERWTDSKHRNKIMEQRSEINRKIRIAKIKKIEESVANGGQIQPAYSFQACKFFEQFDKDFNTRGQYATNGGEYFIKKLGYWPDYINFDLKLIMEWDEEYHYDVDGNLREKDIRRQKEIQEHFPDFRFVRIRERFQEGMDYSFMKVGKKE